MQYVDGATERALNTHIFEHDNFFEAVVYLEVDLWVTGYSEPECPDLFPERKTVHFRGTTFRSDDNLSHLRGKVKMTREGEVVWELVCSLLFFSLSGSRPPYELTFVILDICT
jgi:hypothetical protein